MAERIRIVVAAHGRDGGEHGRDGGKRGPEVIAHALRDAGTEVVYTGPHQTPEQIVQTVLQEDADAVWLSVPDGAHRAVFGRTAELLADHEACDVVLVGGGIVPEPDLAELERIGVVKIFPPGATMDEIVTWVHTNVGMQSIA